MLLVSSLSTTRTARILAVSKPDDHGEKLEEMAGMVLMGKRPTRLDGRPGRGQTEIVGRGPLVLPVLCTPRIPTSDIASV